MISHDILGEWWEKNSDTPWYTMIYHWTLDDVGNPSFETPFHGSPQRYPANSLGKPWQGQQHGLGFAWEKAHRDRFSSLSCHIMPQKNYNWPYSDINPSYNLIVTLSLSHFLATRSTPLRSTSWRFTGAGPPSLVGRAMLSHSSHSPSPRVLRTTALFPSPFLRGA